MRFMLVPKPITQLFVTHDITKPGHYPKLCKDCSHFRIDNVFPNDLKMGRCNKEIQVNLVDGSHILPYADVTRRYDCKGTWWQANIEYTMPLEKKSTGT